MTQDLIDRIVEFNKIKYGENDNETRIVFATLKPDTPVMGSFDKDGNQTWGVTTAPKDK